MKLFSIDADSFKIAIAIFEDKKLTGTLLISADKKLDSDKRGFKLFQDFGMILDNMKPDEICIERSVYLQSFPATKTITEVIGYCKLACNQRNIPFSLVHNTSWKKFVAGKGNAKKLDVKEAIIKLYPEMIDENQDSIDACGIGCYFLFSNKFKKEDELGAKELDG